MGKTQTFKHPPYAYPKNTLTISQVKSAFLDDPKVQNVIKRNIRVYEKRLKDLNAQTKYRVEGRKRYWSGTEQYVWLFVEKLWYNAVAGNIRRHINRLKNFLYVDEKRHGFMSAELVERAKQYPIQDLMRSHNIQVRHNMARCPFHDDRTASMSLKHNRFHCFGCDEKGDTIDFIRKIENVSFVEAVKKLS